MCDIYYKFKRARGGTNNCDCDWMIWFWGTKLHLIEPSRAKRSNILNSTTMVVKNCISSEDFKSTLFLDLTRSKVNNPSFIVLLSMSSEPIIQWVLLYILINPGQPFVFALALSLTFAPTKWPLGWSSQKWLFKPFSLSIYQYQFQEIARLGLYPCHNHAAQYKQVFRLGPKCAYVCVCERDTERARGRERVYVTPLP